MLFAVSVAVVVALAVVGAIALFAIAVAVCGSVAVPLLDVRVLDKSGCVSLKSNTRPRQS